jgi:hypothetical protein
MAKEVDVSAIAAMKHSEISASDEQGGHFQRARVTDANPPDRCGSKSVPLIQGGTGKCVGSEEAN